MDARLDDLLCQNYPQLYADRHAPMAQTCMCWGFDVGNGWYPIIDALSEVITRDAQEKGEPIHPVSQVKEKFGTLRFYAVASDFGHGAIRAAEEMSARICEVTGKPGRLSSDGGWYKTRCFELRKEAEPDEVDHMSADDVETIRKELLAGGLDVPVGLSHLADVLLGVLNPPRRYGNTQAAHPVQVSKIVLSDDGLEVVWTGGGEDERGAVAFSKALAKRMEPTTGNCVIP